MKSYHGKIYRLIKAKDFFGTHGHETSKFSSKRCNDGQISPSHRQPSQNIKEKLKQEPSLWKSIPKPCTSECTTSV